MLANTASQFYPVIDDFAVVRAMVLVIPGREWESKQRCNHVTVAVSFVLGECARDYTAASHEQAHREIERRSALRPPGTNIDVAGWMAICDENNCSYVMVSVLRGREAECQALASSVCFAVARFDRRPMHVRVYEV